MLTHAASPSILFKSEWQRESRRGCMNMSEGESAREHEKAQGNGTSKTQKKRRRNRKTKFQATVSMCYWGNRRTE